MRKYLIVTVATTILFSAVACQKKAEEPMPQVSTKQGPIIDSPITMPNREGEQKIEFEVVVPEEVKARWSAVKLLVEDKKTNKKQEYTVNIGDELKIPDSSLTVKVVYFLPDFKMGGQIITSASNASNNPSVGVIISEDGKKIFPISGKWGWLYSKFPTIHPFQHKRYGLTLKEGVAKQ